VAQNVGRRSAWLSLGQASQVLGITPATLRRWADRGDVPAFVTPGGHRRFSRVAIDRLVPPATPRRAPLKSPDASASRVARGYMRSATEALTPLSQDDRDEFRERGRRLLDLVIESLNEDARPRAGVATATREAAEYGRRAARAGAPMPEAIGAFVRFRRALMSELASSARRRHLTATELAGLMLEAEQVVDQLLLALTEGYSGGRP